MKRFKLPSEAAPNNDVEILLLTVILAVSIVAIVYLSAAMVHELFMMFPIVNF